MLVLSGMCKALCYNPITEKKKMSIIVKAWNNTVLELKKKKKQFPSFLSLFRIIFVFVGLEIELRSSQLLGRHVLLLCYVLGPLCSTLDKELCVI